MWFKKAGQVVIDMHFWLARRVQLGRTRIHKPPDSSIEFERGGVQGSRDGKATAVAV